MEVESALPIRVLEWRLWSYWRCENGRCYVAEERNFAHSVFFAELFRLVGAVVERRAPHWLCSSKTDPWLLKTQPHTRTCICFRFCTHLNCEHTQDNVFSRSHVKEAEETDGRIVVIVCDGAQGSCGRLLGISDECIQHSCNTYGAIASLERNCERQEFPMAEKRIHQLIFDLTSYGVDSLDESYTPGFSLKLFGSNRHRYMTLVIPKCESKCVKALRVILDRSMMRNIFTKCFNTFRFENETKLAESEALKNMKFSPRLFEIKMFQRQENVAYFSDPDIFILAEGDAAMCYNFSTGMDVNIGLKNLVTLPNFLEMVSWAETENHITSVLTYKTRHTEKVCRNFVRCGLREYMFS
ncbi:uncharacterized protein LOC118767619 [Octopus sinensis]|uniref:Uncharacterized protein LOC118767619 n=1 Tax=Octopus sinensis TaxID=2607531 RepID=A0A7E6FLJ3_9MOLL|nr:uncharacterized protein LOC118767619 [Octopus sinensis]